MNIETFKSSLEENKFDYNFVVLSWEDSPFIAYQYLNKIKDILNVEFNYVQSLENLNRTDFELLFEDTPVWNIFITEKLSLTAAEIAKCKNLIIICKNIDAKTKEKISENLITIPKLQLWQLQEYTSINLPGVSEEDRNWLVDIVKNDIFRLDNEISKISIFEKELQQFYFDLIKDEHGYNDLQILDIFKFINALVNKDTSTICHVLSHLDSIDVEGTGIVTLMLKNIKRIIDVQLNSRATAKELGITDKQFNFIKYKQGKLFSQQQLVEVYSFLTSIDYELKSGRLPFTNNRLVDYLVCNILNIII